MSINAEDLRLAGAHTWTPVVRLRLRYRGVEQEVWLKLEGCNPTGSIKYRTAIGLLNALNDERRLSAGTTIAESTSGNLGLALAWLANALGCRYVAVVDPKLPPATRALLCATGAELAMVSEPDEHGSYLLSRLRRVRELCANDPEVRWPDQYENIANPGVHVATGMELLEQTDGRIDMVVVAVSTGGTLAGISECLRRAIASVYVIAVDVLGSLAISDVAHPHLLTGIGAARKSSFLRTSHYDEVALVSDVDAFAYCRMLAEDTGLALGGSSGAVLAAVADRLGSGSPRRRCPVLVCPDGGDKYSDTIYNDGWLSHHGVLARVRAAITDARTDGLSLDME
jgi:cysteine synthase A